MDLVKYSPSSYPTSGFVGNTEYTVMYAGESCGLAHDIKPAAQIVHDLTHEAEAVIEQMQRM